MLNGCTRSVFIGSYAQMDVSQNRCMMLEIRARNDESCYGRALIRRTAVIRAFCRLKAELPHLSSYTKLLYKLILYKSAYLGSPSICLTFILGPPCIDMSCISYIFYHLYKQGGGDILPQVRTWHLLDVEFIPAHKQRRIGHLPVVTPALQCHSVQVLIGDTEPGVQFAAHQRPEWGPPVPHGVSGCYLVLLVVFCEFGHKQILLRLGDSDRKKGVIHTILTISKELKKINSVFHPENVLKYCSVSVLKVYNSYGFLLRNNLLELFFLWQCKKNISPSFNIYP